MGSGSHLIRLASFIHHSTMSTTSDNSCGVRLEIGLMACATNLCSGRVGGEQAPVNVSPVPEVWVVAVLSG